MIKNQILVFLLRWLISSAGMWLCISFFGTVTTPEHFWLYVIAGLIFSLVNSVVKPLLTMLALPLIILTMGIFTFILNLGMVALTFWLLPGAEMDFLGILVTTIIMGIINTLVNLLVPSYNKTKS